MWTGWRETQATDKLGWQNIHLIFIDNYSVAMYKLFFFFFYQLLGGYPNQNVQGVQSMVPVWALMFVGKELGWHVDE